MKTKQALSLAITILVATTAPADNIRFIWSGGGVGDGSSFNDPGNWGGEAANGSNLPGDVMDSPTDATNVILQTGGTATTTVNAPFTAANPFDVFIVRGGHTLNVAANLTLTGIPTLLGQTGSGNLLNHTAGTFDIGNLSIGDTGLNAVATYDLKGTGMLSAAAINVRNGSTLRLTGTTLSANATSLSLDGTSILDLVFGDTGLPPIALTGGFNVTTGAQLNIDGASYSGGGGVIDLVTFGGNTGTFADPANISISGFSGFTSAVGYDADSMYLSLTAVPEPASALLLLMGATGLLLRRRR